MHQFIFAAEMAYEKKTDETLHCVTLVVLSRFRIILQPLAVVAMRWALYRIIITHGEPHAQSINEQIFLPFPRQPHVVTMQPVRQCIVVPGGLSSNEGTLILQSAHTFLLIGSLRLPVYIVLPLCLEGVVQLNYRTTSGSEVCRPHHMLTQTV
jgi:hypothetical protein